jgi:hypothetical protein
MNGTGDCHIKQNEPDSERQMPPIFSHRQNLDVKKKKKKDMNQKGDYLGRGRGPVGWGTRDGKRP